MYLTKEMKEFVTKQLIKLWEEIYSNANSKMLTNPFLILLWLLPNDIISKITSTLLQLTQEALENLIDENETMKVHALKIWTVICKLQTSFKQQLKQKADEKEQKRCISLFSQTPG